MSDPVRHKLLEVMSANPGLGPGHQIYRWLEQTVNEQFDYVVELVNSRFVTCPRGIGTSTYRLYEALKLGHVEVIMSDDWLPPKAINWNSCSLRISEEKLIDLPALLNACYGCRPEMSSAASSVWFSFLAIQCWRTFDLINSNHFLIISSLAVVGLASNVDGYNLPLGAKISRITGKKPSIFSTRLIWLLLTMCFWESLQRHVFKGSKNSHRCPWAGSHILFRLWQAAKSTF